MDVRGLKVVVPGGRTGLLGQALVRAFTDAGAEVTALGSADCDVTDPAAVRAMLDSLKPNVVLNGTAYTMVDKAEDEPDKARALNADAPAILAEACKERDVFLVHYGTDFVFSGDIDRPHTEDDPTGPRSVYGRTKLDGEMAVLDIYPENSLVVRIAWVFGPDKLNIVRKFLDLASDRDQLTVINDQFGSPTYTPDAAAHTLALLRADVRGLFHAPNAGAASWFELASAAVELAGIDCEVTPIPTSAYPAKAVRPASSILCMDKFTGATKKAPRHWREALHDYIDLLRERGELRT